LTAKGGGTCTFWAIISLSLGIAPWDQWHSIGLCELILQTTNGKTLRSIVFPLFVNFISYFGPIRAFKRPRIETFWAIISPSLGLAPPKSLKTCLASGSCLMPNFAPIGPATAEKSLTEQTNKKNSNQYIPPVLQVCMEG